MIISGLYQMQRFRISARRGPDAYGSLRRCLRSDSLRRRRRSSLSCIVIFFVQNRV